jgi:hypothetical protein
MTGAKMGAAWTHEHASKIAELANEISDRANQLLEDRSTDISAETDLSIAASQGAISYQVENDYLALKAESFFKTRRYRDTVFGETDLFSDPCWDILLDLFIAHRRNRNISVTSACLAAQVPATTALRWITVMEKMGLVKRQRDITDSRRRLVSLTPSAIKQVSDILASSA